MLENTKGMKKAKSTSTVKKIIFKSKEFIRLNIKDLVIYFVCIFVCRSSIIGELFPCAVAFLCAYFYAKGPSIAVLAISLISIATVKLEPKYMFICVLIYTYYLIIKNRKRSYLLYDAFGFSIILLTINTVIMIYNGFLLNMLLINIFEALFIISSTFIIREVIVSIKKGSFNVGSTACLLALIFISVLGFREIQLLNFNILMFMIFFSIIFVSAYISPFAGMMLGLAFGFFNYTKLNISAYYMLALGFGGISLGIVKNKYKPLSGILFVAISFAMLFYFKNFTLYLENIVELSFAVFLFTIISFSFNDKLNKLMGSDEQYNKRANEAINKLRKLCSAINELTKAYREPFGMKKTFSEYATSAHNNRERESNDTVISQLQETSDILNDTIAKMQYYDISSKTAKANITNAVKHEKIIIKGFDVNEDSDSVGVIITVATERKLNEVCDIISDSIYNTTGLKMKCCEKIVSTDKYYVLRFNVMQKISAKAYYAKLTKENSEISGDNYSYGIIDNKFYGVLCDGVGTGARAFNESKSLISLLIKLLDANFNEKQIIKTLNSLLLLNMDEDRYVTLDFGIIDFEMHQLRMYKAGAAQSYLITDNEIKKFQSNSLPIGILDTVECYYNAVDIKHNDVFIMMTDGIIDSIDNDVQKSLDNYLNLIKNKDPQTIANNILTYAVRGCNRIIDDMTVLVIKIV